MDVRKRRKGTTEEEPLLIPHSEDIYREKPKDKRREVEYPTSQSNQGGTLSSYSYEYISQFISSFWNYVSFFWSELRKIIKSGNNTTLPDIDPEVKLRMSEFQKHISVSFNVDDQSHYDALVQLWNIFFQEEPFSLSSTNWKKLGFQSDNPLSDFRACGYFGLKNLLYFSEKYPTKFQVLADVNESRSGEYYPFAVASFNVTMMICELLGWGWKRPGVSTAKDPKVHRKLISMLFPPNFSIELCENVFCELYSLALFETDQEWNKSNASYMDFPVVIVNSQERLECHLRNFKGIEDLFQFNQQNLSG